MSEPDYPETCMMDDYHDVVGAWLHKWIYEGQVWTPRIKRGAKSARTIVAADVTNVSFGSDGRATYQWKVVYSLPSGGWRSAYPWEFHEWIVKNSARVEP